MNRKHLPVWKYDRRRNTLSYRSYEIDLDQARTPEEVDSWVEQVGSKTWASPAVLEALTEALRAVNS